MANVRTNVYELGADWADPILWYARAVKAMRDKPFNDLTSWRFFGALHGYDLDLWQKFGYYTPGSDKLWTSAIKGRYLGDDGQCQHQTWYFFPWHRGYLLAFEDNVRATIKALGGPENWTLPYWNYFKSGQSKLPPAFSSKAWPDGAADNPLFIQARHGPNDDGNVYVIVGGPNGVTLDAIGDDHFTGSGANHGFGGPKTGFNWAGGAFGGLEVNPHGLVHVLVGGQETSGLMSDPATAALDPIFWLHHANIDRLWEVWRRSDTAHLNPADPQWLQGPGSTGDREFVSPLHDGSPYVYTPTDVADLAKLGYTYDEH